MLKLVLGQTHRVGNRFRSEVSRHVVEWSKGTIAASLVASLLSGVLQLGDVLNTNAITMQ